MTDRREAPPQWWREAIIYHVYLPSFQDGNGDGTGDLPGLHERLDYLEWLGVDAIWVSPFFRSHMEDHGYDVTDYTSVDPVFGTLNDVDALVADIHARGMRLILDFVVNHTSRHHPWFRDAATARDSRHRDWYIWRDPRPDCAPPNNWRSINAPDTPGSAWFWHEATQQYLLCTFAPTQPDLNWMNPAVAGAMTDAMRFWLERGVDGFRLDMVDFVGKDPEFADEPSHPPGVEYFSACTVQLHLGETLRHIACMRSVLDEHPGRVAIGEVGALMPLERLTALHDGGRGLDLPGNFRLLFLPWEAGALRAFIDDYDAALVDTGWPNWVLSNHDMPRMLARGEQIARLAAMLLLTLRGTPFLYYGEELGMANAVIPRERLRDQWRTPETGLGRDPSRTPMQWSPSRHAGFTAADEPWLPVSDDHTTLNVQAAREDPASMLRFVHTLIELRRRLPALRHGTYRSLSTAADERCLAFSRTAPGHETVVLLNLSGEPVRANLPAGAWWRALSTRGRAGGGAVSGGLLLDAHEGAVLWRDTPTASAG